MNRDPIEVLTRLIVFVGLVSTVMLQTPWGLRIAAIGGLIYGISILRTYAVWGIIFIIVAVGVLFGAGKMYEILFWTP